jgi:hypothetical protein
MMFSIQVKYRLQQKWNLSGIRLRDDPLSNHWNHPTDWTSFLKSNMHVAKLLDLPQHILCTRMIIIIG